MSCTRMTTQPFLFLPLPPFVIFDSDYALISCPLCKSNTLWNILMILNRNVEQDKTMCPSKNTILTFLLLELSPYKKDNSGKVVGVGGGGGAFFFF